MRDAATRPAGPSFERYVAGLPGGLGAHPGAQGKGSLVRSVLEEQPRELLAALPEPLRVLAQDPPIDSDWIPEAHICALIHGVAEVRGFSERELLAWCRARNRALFERPLYRILMAVVSPESMLRHAGIRWGNFHRGSTLAFDGFSDDGARLTLTFPDGLFDGLILRAFGEAMAAALEAARARDPSVEVERAGPGVARYLARW